MIYLKSPVEIKKMRDAGRIVARTLGEIRNAIKPGVSTWDLDQIAIKVLVQHGAKPAFLGYPPGSKHPFPATITACINNELVHGIPNKNRVLQEGDLITVDTGCHYDGYVGDAAFTMGVGQISEIAQRLLEVTEQALYVGIKASIVGRETRDVAQAIQRFVESQGFNVIRGYTGHGVGRKMHEDPEVPNWWPDRHLERRLRRRFVSVPLKSGMTYALEPMVSVGSHETVELDDHWTVMMKDGSLCAQFEHTIAVVDQEPLILTMP